MNDSTLKRIEDTNTVGEPAERIQEHVFTCHEEIRALRDRNAKLWEECRERGQEIARLKQGIAAASILLEKTACGIS